MKEEEEEGGEEEEEEEDRVEEEEVSEVRGIEPGEKVLEGRKQEDEAVDTAEVAKDSPLEGRGAFGEKEEK